MTAAPASSAPPASAAADQSHRALAGAVRSVSLITLISRFAGLIREVLVVRIFGGTAVGSAFVAAFAIPNLFRRLFGEGALSAAFIPEYTQSHKQDAGAADRFASLTLIALLLITTLLTIVIELALAATLLAFSHPPERAFSIRLIMVMLPFMPLVCTAAILGGMLQVHGRFAPAAAGPVLLNTLIVATGLYFLTTGTHGDATVAYALGIATVISGGTQCAWFALLLRRYVRWSRAFHDARERGARMLRRFIPVLIGMGTLQINTFLDSFYAMWPIWIGPTLLGFKYPMDEASNIILASAQRLYHFPLGVFGIAVATAVFPLLSRHADEPEQFLQTLRRGLRLSLFIGLPASAGLLLIRHDLTAVLYGYGHAGFTPESLARSAAALAGFAPAVWAYSINHVLTRAFYARGNTTTPMRIAIGMVFVNAVLNLILIWPLGEAGLAWATSTSAIVQCIFLAIALRSTPAFNGRLIDSGSVRSAALLVVAVLIMSGVVLLFRFLVPLPAGWTGSLIGVLLTAAAGVISFTAAAGLLRLPELGWLIRR